MCYAHVISCTLISTCTYTCTCTCACTCTCTVVHTVYACTCTSFLLLSFLLLSFPPHNSPISSTPSSPSSLSLPASPSPSPSPRLTNFPVTVLEYAGPLHTLSSQDVDQMLLHSPLEECMVTVDTTMMRVLEVVLSTNKTRSQRDLGECVHISLSVAPPVMERSYRSIPSGILRAHTE